MPPGFSFSVNLKVSCVKCGKAREFPDEDELEGLTATDERGLTVGTSARCRCGAKRVRIGAEIDDGHKPSPKPGR
jgi:hypothetical protein